MSSKKQKLELTWIEKENRPKLELRILVEDPEKSYHAKHRVKEAGPFTTENTKNTKITKNAEFKQQDSSSLSSLWPKHPGALFDNKLIFGDNLLALKALEPPQTKCRVN